MMMNKQSSSVLSSDEKSERKSIERRVVKDVKCTAGDANDGGVSVLAA